MPTEKERLQQQLDELRASIADWEGARATADEIAKLSAKRTELQISTDRSIKGAEVANLRRLERGLTAMSPINAYNVTKQYQEGADANRPIDQAGIFMTQYIKDVRDDLKTAFSGIEARTVPKSSGKDSLEQFAGMAKSWKSTLAGIGVDIATDPTGFAIGGTFKIGSKIARGGAAFTKSYWPSTGKIADAIGSRWNVMYGVNKYAPTADAAAQYQDAYIRALNDTQAALKFRAMASNPARVAANPELASELQKLVAHGLDVAADTRGPVLKGYDAATNWIKSKLPLSPRFQVRNATDAVLTNALNGVGPMSYWKSLRLGFGGAPSPNDASIIAEMAAKGRMTTGAADIGKNSWAGKAMGWIETYIANMPAVFREVSKGSSIKKAVEKATVAQLEYQTPMFTKWQQEVMFRIFPYGKFTINNLKRWDEYIPTKATRLGGAAHADMSTEEDYYRDNPHLKPDWQKSWRVGGTRGYGSSLENFVDTFNPKQIINQIGPTIKTAIELGTGKSTFTGQNIYESPMSMARWGLNTGFGPAMQFPNDVWDMKTGTKQYTVWEAINKSLTSIRKDNDYGVGGLASISSRKREDQKSNINFDSLLNFFRSGVLSAGASGNVDPVVQARIKMVADWTKDHPDQSWAVSGRDLMDKSTEAMARNRMFDERQQGLEMFARNTQVVSANPLVNDQRQLRMHIARLHETQGFKGNYGDAEYAQMIKDYQAEYNATAPIDADKFYGDAEDLFSKKYHGKNFQEMAINAGKKTLSQALSKAIERMKKGIEASPDFKSIADTAQIEKGTILRQAASELYRWSKEDIEKMLASVDIEAGATAKKLQGEINRSKAATLMVQAKSLPEGPERIKAEENAKIAEFLASDAGQKLSASDKPAHFARVMAYQDEGKQLLHDRIAEEAKSMAELMASMAKSELQPIQTALQSLYQRGGMSISDYYAGENKAAAQSGAKVATGDLRAFLTQYQGDTSGLKEFGDTINGTSLSKTIDILIRLYAAMELAVKDVNAGDVKKLQTIMKSLVANIGGLKEKAATLEGSKLSEQDKLNAAVLALERSTATQRAGALTRLENAGVAGGGWRMGDLWKDKPSGFQAAYEEQMKAQRTGGFQAMAGINEKIKATDVNLPTQDPEEADEIYQGRIEAEIGFLSEQENLTIEGQAKLKALKDQAAATDMERAAMVAEHEKQTLDMRMGLAINMADTMTKTAELMYEASGRQSLAAFRVWKAMAFASAAISGAKAVMDAYDSGMKVGSIIPGAGPAFAAASAAVASAFVGAQLGLIAAQGVRGFKEGGKITSGTGPRTDDVPIMVSRGEWVVPAHRASQVGDVFMTALIGTKGMNVPSVTPGHFADGGMITGSGGGNIKVEMINRTSAPIKATQGDVFFNGQEMIVSVFLDALDRDVGGLRTRLGG